MNRIKHLTLGILLSMLIMSCSSPKGVLNLWKTNINCNGKLDEWKTPLRFAKNRMQYDFSNNEDTLFICVKMADELMNKKVMMNGLNLWIDTSARQKDRMCIGITSNKPKSKEIEIGRNPIDQKTDSVNLNLKYISEINELNVKGFLSVPNGKLKLKNNYGINFGIATDVFNNLTYEIAIPYSCFIQNKLTSIDTNKIVSIGFEIDGMKSFEGKMSGGGGPMGGGDGAMPPPPMGGGPGFGGDGAMPSVPPPDMMKMYTEYADLFSTVKFWQNITLKIKQ